MDTPGPKLAWWRATFSGSASLIRWAIGGSTNRPCRSIAGRVHLIRFLGPNIGSAQFWSVIRAQEGSRFQRPARSSNTPAIVPMLLTTTSAPAALSVPILVGRFA